MGHVHKYPQKPTSSFMFLRGQATLYKRWILTLWTKHVGFPLYRLQTCGSSLYQAILYKVGRKASSELYMGDVDTGSNLG